MNTVKLLDNYFEWLKKGYTINHLGKCDEIVTPFVDDINDNITIYVEEVSDKQIMLTDDGYTIANLEFMGIKLTPTRRRLIDSVCQQFHIKIIEDETLSIVGTPKEFPIMKYQLTSAILRINDTSFTQKENVKSFFAEDVLNYFDTNNFGGLPTTVRGQSGVEYKFLYALPKRKDKPLILFNIQNNISANEIMLDAFKHNDIKKSANLPNMYAQSRYVVIFNEKQKNISEKAAKIAQAYDIDVISWENKAALAELKN